MKRIAGVLLAVTMLGHLGCDNPKKTKATKEDSSEERSSSDGDDKPAKGSDAKGKDARKLTQAYPGNLAGATALVKAFGDAKTDKVALTRALRPDPADYKAIFAGDYGAKVEAKLKDFWEAENFKGIGGGKPGQTEVIVHAISTEDIAAWNEKAGALPGGYKNVKDDFQKGLVVYRFKFVEPGEKLGTANDGLIHVNGHWVIVPKPWRAKES